MSSNLPPGVSGNEYAIAGPAQETEEQRTCSTCGYTDIVYVLWYDYAKWFFCDSCGAENDLSSEIPDPTDIEAYGEGEPYE